MSSTGVQQRRQQPLACIQHDWAVDVDAGRGAFWVSVRAADAPTVHGKVAVTSHSQLKADGDYTATLAANKALIKLEHPRLGRFGFLRPQTTFSTGSALHDIALSPAGGLLLTAGEAGALNIYMAADHSLQRQLKGHAGAVYCCKFFPSGEVALTAGADHTLKIWSVSDGDCAATLRGHTAGVTGTGMIERGRNVVSCSRDGSVRLWECGSQQQLRVVWPHQAAGTSTSLMGPALHALAIASCSSADGAGLPPPAENEYGTDGKLVVAGGERKTLVGIDLRAQTLAFKPALPESANAIQSVDVVADANQLFAGTSNGEILLYDLRASDREPLATYFRNDVPINRILASRSPQLYHFAAATDQGQVLLWPAEGSELATVDLTGPDIDAVTAMSQIEASTLLTGCADGSVRTYNLAQVLAA